MQRLLFDSIAQMDEEGLVFLLRQAHIFSSNANTERINREIEAFERDRGPAPVPEAGAEAGGGFIPARILRTFLEKPILTVGIASCDAENRPSKPPA